MRSLKSGFLALAVSGLIGVGAVVGCSASGDGSGITDQSGTQPDPTATSAVPPENPGSVPPDPPQDAGHKDSGKKDGSVDAGPPPPNPGDPCTKVDALANKPCGACGTQQAICQGDADAGTLKWSAYGQCTGEIAGGCTPTKADGTANTQTCGNCGTQTCSKYCAWGSCTEPAGACKPLATDYSTAGCATPNTYRNRACDNTCKWSSFSTTCTAPNNPNKMQIGGSIGATVQQKWTFSPSTVGEKLEAFGGTCPGTTSGSADANYQYVAVEVQNTTAKKATVTIYDTRAPGSTTDLDTIMWIYNKTLPPTDETTLAACDYPSTDSCPSGVTCGAAGVSTYLWAGINNVTINAGASVLVYSAGYTTSVTGDFSLAVKTDNLQ